jgi:hypothetical protein
MQAQEYMAAELFRSGKQLRVPIWQRRYSWMKEQWTAMWGDLERLRQDPGLTHFIGSVVVRVVDQPKGGMPDSAEQFELVDGQQRATTLTLLRVAIRDRLAALPGAKDRDVLTRQMLINGDKREDHKPRLVLQQLDDPSLRAVVDGDPSGDSLVQEAHQFFTKQLLNHDEQQLLALESTIQTRLRVVWIKLDKDDNAHRVFQTINAGGRPLRQADLVRNFFFLLLAGEGQSFYQQHWIKLEKDMDAGELERYFSAWTMAKGYAGTKEALFHYFDQDLVGAESDPKKVWQYGVRLVNEAPMYRRILGKESDPDLKVEAALEWLRGWGTTPTEGLLLKILLLREAGRLDAESTARCLELVYSFLARRFVAGNAPNLHKSILRQICHQVGKNETAKDGSLVEFLRVLLSRGSELKRWPTNQEVIDQASVGILYTKARAAWAKSVLARINHASFKNPKHAPTDLRLFTVEHVMPQDLSSDWRNDLTGWGVKDPSDLHKRKLHVLGNITLTLINPELSNKRLAAKLELLADDSLLINKQLKVAKSWTETSITDRSRELATQLVGAISGPMSESELKASPFYSESDAIDAADAVGEED